MIRRLEALAEEMPPGPVSKDRTKTGEVSGVVTQIAQRSPRLMFMTVRVCDPLPGRREEADRAGKPESGLGELPPRASPGPPAPAAGGGHNPDLHGNRSAESGEHTPPARDVPPETSQPIGHVEQHALELAGGAPPELVDLVLKVNDGFFTAEELGALLQGREGAPPVLHVGAAVWASGFLERTAPEVRAAGGALAVLLHVDRLQVDGRIPDCIRPSASAARAGPAGAAGERAPPVAKWAQGPGGGRGDGVRRSKQSGNRARSANGNRAAVFAAFLLDTFGGAPALQRGTGVCDIAGGQGGLAFELALRHGVRAVLVDPVKARLSNRQLRALHQRIASDRALKAFSALALPPAATPVAPGQAPQAAGEAPQAAGEAPQAPGGAPAAGGGPPVAGGGGCAAAVQGEGLSSGGGGGASPAAVGAGEYPDLFQQLQCRFEADGAGALQEERGGGGAALRAAVEGASVLVGLHPDEATDAIVDAALNLRKPFAVIPCCVFPSRFVKRRTPGGEAVATHAQLVEYLVGKHPAIRQTTLNFEGRNTCVYYCPPPSSTEGAPAPTEAG